MSIQDEAKDAKGDEGGVLKPGESMDADADNASAEAAAAAGGEKKASQADPTAETPSPMETDEVEQLA